MPVTRCPHGNRIEEVWWECPSCVRDNELSREDLAKLKSNHQKSKWESSSRQRSSIIVEDNSFKAKDILKITILSAILLYFVVGFGGCLVRIVATNDWITSNSPGSTFASYTREAVLVFFIVLAIGIYKAIRASK